MSSEQSSWTRGLVGLLIAEATMEGQDPSVGFGTGGIMWGEGGTEEKWGAEALKDTWKGVGWGGNKASRVDRRIKKKTDGSGCRVVQLFSRALTPHSSSWLQATTCYPTWQSLETKGVGGSD